MARMTEELGLSDAQRAKLQKIRKDSFNGTQADRKRIKTLKKSMREAWKADKPDGNEIKRLYREMHALKGHVGEKRIDEHLAMHAVLTPEQRVKMEEMKRNKRNHMDRGFKKHGKGNGRSKDQKTGKNKPHRSKKTA